MIFDFIDSSHSSYIDLVATDWSTPLWILRLIWSASSADFDSTLRLPSTLSNCPDFTQVSSREAAPRLIWGFQLCWELHDIDLVFLNHKITDWFGFTWCLWFDFKFDAEIYNLRLHHRAAVVSIWYRTPELPTPPPHNIAMSLASSTESLLGLITHRIFRCKKWRHGIGLQGHEESPN